MALYNAGSPGEMYDERTPGEIQPVQSPSPTADLDVTTSKQEEFFDRIETPTTSPVEPVQKPRSQADTPQSTTPNAGNEQDRLSTTSTATTPPADPAPTTSPVDPAPTEQHDVTDITDQLPDDLINPTPINRGTLPEDSPGGDLNAIDATQAAQQTRGTGSQNEDAPRAWYDPFGFFTGGSDGGTGDEGGPATAVLAIGGAALLYLLSQ